ncbi:MAG: hypothetical protein HY875_10895 [Chloroflexi bacterium]|nr:hypothetical protein [Chloroflexota bacterium]
MRTTLNLDDDLVIEAKLLAVRTRRTLTAVIEEALRKSLAEPAPAEKARAAYELPVSTARGGLLPGVNLADNSALLEIMEGEGDAASGASGVASLPRWDGGGFPEGVDIDDNSALLEIMEGDDDAAPGREPPGLRVPA